MDAATAEAFNRLMVAGKAHPLAGLLVNDAGWEIAKAAASDGLTGEQAVKVRRMVDTPQERDTVLSVLRQLVVDSDAILLLTWLRDDITRALAVPIDLKPADDDPTTPEPSKPSEPTPTGPTDDVDMSAVKWLGKGSCSWPIKSDLNAEITDKGIYFTIRSPLGNNCYACAVVTGKDGKLYGGTYDGVGDLHEKDKRKYKSFSNLYGKLDGGGSKGGPYFAQSGPFSDEKKSRELLQIGRKPFWVFVVSLDDKTRTTARRVVPKTNIA